MNNRLEFGVDDIPFVVPFMHGLEIIDAMRIAQFDTVDGRVFTWANGREYVYESYRVERRRYHVFGMPMIAQSSAVLSEIARLKSIPGNDFGLLALAHAFPQLQTRHKIVELGHTQFIKGCRSVLTISSHGAKRTLAIEPFDSLWPFGTYFLAYLPARAGN